MAEYRIVVDLSPLTALGNFVASSAFPNLAHAVAQVAEKAQSIWQGYAGGEPLPGGGVIKARSGAYMRSIKVDGLGDFSAEVYSDSAYARSIEEGAPARDLKRMLDTSLKVRVTKDGRRYLIIPFRWGTPGSAGFGKNVMPTAVHDAWRQKAAGGKPLLAPSRVTGQGQRESGTGAWDPRTRSPLMVAQRQYKWGDRMTKESLHAMGVHGEAAKRMTGMVRFQNPTAEGGSKHSQYMTFRVMVEGSNGWIAPPRPGMYPARATANRIRPVAEQIFREAVVADLKGITG